MAASPETTREIKTFCPVCEPACGVIAGRPDTFRIARL